MRPWGCPGMSRGTPVIVTARPLHQRSASPAGPVVPVLSRPSGAALHGSAGGFSASSRRFLVGCMDSITSEWNAHYRAQQLAPKERVRSRPDGVDRHAGQTRADWWSCSPPFPLADSRRSATASAAGRPPLCLPSQKRNGPKTGEPTRFRSVRRPVTRAVTAVATTVAALLLSVGAPRQPPPTPATTRWSYVPRVAWSEALSGPKAAASSRAFPSPPPPRGTYAGARPGPRAMVRRAGPPNRPVPAPSCR